MTGAPAPASVDARSGARTLVQTRPDPSLPHVLDVEHVSVNLGGRPILDDVSFWVPRGEFVCLCGPNGAGKSTLLKAILGLVPVTRGSISIGQAGSAAGRHAIGYVPQRKSFERDFPARAVDVIVAALRGNWPCRIRPGERARARAILDRVGGGLLLDRPLAGLSGGEIQRVFLARALITEPTLVLLDEPTAGVDARGRAELLELLASLSRSREVSVILVTHDLAAVARTAERVVYLEAGRILGWGLPGELIGPESLTALTALTAFQGRDHHAQAAGGE